MRTPRYPIYVPSKGRADKPFTIEMFLRAGMDFHVVVEPQEVKNYSVFGDEHLLVLPDNDRGLVYARNWIKDYSVAGGYERHWQFDDDIRYMSRAHKGYRIRCAPNVAIVAAEDFVDRYENVALASFNSEHFVPAVSGFGSAMPPFYLNHRCYTVFLALNSLPNRWRFRYNEDTDMTLQVLADGWCTVLFNAFLIKTPRTMTHGGGQTDIYVDDGRLRMSRQLERVWRGVVTTTRRFQRPQHKIKGEWRKFDTPLKFKAGVSLDQFRPDEYGLRLTKKREPKSELLQELYREMTGDQENTSE